ncbi:MAG: hypothetical protein ABJH68_16200 [Ilumatobacter sp.]|uniref:hypothetical protein n=2 Tax=Ilumatobacter sp. TaxID=1967498 RepID=UPI003297DA9B
MAIHERDLFDTSTDQPAWPHPHDESAFTTGCPECDFTRMVLSIQRELRLTVRDLWISGWTPNGLADEIRRRIGTGARDLVIHALLDENETRSDQAKAEDWTRQVACLATEAGVDDCDTGWVARWTFRQKDRTVAGIVLFDALDALHDLLPDPG